MNKVQEYIGDKKWMNEPGRPDDTDFRAAIDLLEQLHSDKAIGLIEDFERRKNDNNKTVTRNAK